MSMCVCVSVPSQNTHFRVLGRPLVEEHIPNIGLSSQFFWTPPHQFFYVRFWTPLQNRALKKFRPPPKKFRQKIGPPFFFEKVSSQTNIRNAIFDQRSTRPPEGGVSRWHRHTDGHGDSMTNSAQWGQVGENQLTNHTRTSGRQSMMNMKDDSQTRQKP